MSNGIALRQNSENSLKYLSAQRQMYSDLKFISGLQFLFCILASSILSILLLFISDYIIGTIINFIIAIVVVILNKLFDKFIEKQREIAAYIQQIFDLDVFKMKWIKEDFGKIKDISYNISVKSNKYLKKHENFNDLKNWYSIQYDELPLDIGVYYCQKENVRWDSKLRQILRVIYLILIVSISLIIVIYCIAKSKLVIDLMSIMIVFTPLFQYWLSKRNQLLEDIKKIKSIIDWQLLTENNIDKIEKVGIYSLQSLIFEHRKNCVLIYDFIYNIFKGKYQNEASIHASYVKSKYDK